MSAPSDLLQSEPVSQKEEDSTNSLTKADVITSNVEASANEDADTAKEEAVSKSVSNGALAESETKVVANGLESPINGQEEKPIDGQQRPIPDLLPLTASPTPAPPAGANTTSTNQPKESTNSQLLPINTAATPVVATKSAPPPLSSSPKTRGRATTSSVATSSPSKERKATHDKEEPAEEKKETKKRKTVTKKRDSIASSDSTEKGDGDSADGDVGRKSKRARTRTQPFQSSDMEASLLKQVIKASAQSTAAAAAQAKANEEKLVVFFKGEFLAVRNAEGGFYVCQAMQNINRGSHKIRIRWLSQTEKEEPKTKRRGKPAETTEPAKDETGFDIYTPDFYDSTDFECILTNLELEKFGKDRYGLPEEERTRTENILRRALEVEQGKVDNLELTEEHPDGLDVSLFHDESQLKRKRRKKGNKQTTDEDDDSESSESEEESDSKEAVATTSGHSRKVCKPAEPEPRTSTSGVASTSSGRGTKRTRAAAARQIQMRYRDDDDEDSTEDDDDDDDDMEEADSSSDSDAGKRRRGRPSTRRAQKTPVSKVSAKTSPATRSSRGKKLATPKRGPIQIIKKATPKTPAKETTSKRRKVMETQEENEESSPTEKVVTVDVEMTANEAGDNDKDEPAASANESETKEAQDTKEVEQTRSEEAEVAQPTEETKVEANDNETPSKDEKSENEDAQKEQEAPAPEVAPASAEPIAKSEPVETTESKETAPEA